MPYTYSFGRDTGANVGFQVNIMNARIAIGVNVYPGSNVTVQDNIGPITIGYYFSDVMTPVTLSGFQPVGPANAVYSDQGRTFTLINARLELRGSSTTWARARRQWPR